MVNFIWSKVKKIVRLWMCLRVVCLSVWVGCVVERLEDISNGVYRWMIIGLVGL